MATEEPTTARLRTGHFSRRATWLELFYDLVYVVVIAKLAHLITHPHDGHVSLYQYALFATLFVPVWWAWTGHMMFQNRFDPDDVPQKLLTLLQMLAACLMAVFITGAFADSTNAFALSYVAIRTLLIVMYWRVHRLGGEHTNVTRLLMTGFSCGALLWLISVFFPGPWKFWLWGAGLLVDMITPWLGRERLSKASVHAAHLPERLGLLSIIVLGESVVSIIGGIEGSGITGATVVATVFGFLLLGAIWWLYFHSLETSLMNAEYTNGQLAIYGHLPVYLGLVTIAAGVRFGITGELSSVETGALLCGGMLLFLLPLQIIHWSRLSGKRARQFVVTNVVLNSVMAGLGLLSVFLTPIWILGLVALVYTAYVIRETLNDAGHSESVDL
jgi:low temperature requirement protein LtrA